MAEGHLLLAAAAVTAAAAAAVGRLAALVEDVLAGAVPVQRVRLPLEHERRDDVALSQVLVLAVVAVEGPGRRDGDPHVRVAGRSGRVAEGHLLLVAAAAVAAAVAVVPAAAVDLVPTAVAAAVAAAAVALVPTAVAAAAVAATVAATVAVVPTAGARPAAVVEGGLAGAAPVQRVGLPLVGEGRDDVALSQILVLAVVAVVGPGRRDGDLHVRVRGRARCVTQSHLRLGAPAGSRPRWQCRGDRDRSRGSQNCCPGRRTRNRPLSDVRVSPHVVPFSLHHAVGPTTRTGHGHLSPKR